MFKIMIQVIIRIFWNIGVFKLFYSNCRKAGISGVPTWKQMFFKSRLSSVTYKTLLALPFRNLVWLFADYLLWNRIYTIAQISVYMSGRLHLIYRLSLIHRCPVFFNLLPSQVRLCNIFWKICKLYQWFIRHYQELRVWGIWESLIRSYLGMKWLSLYFKWQNAKHRT